MLVFSIPCAPQNPTGFKSRNPSSGCCEMPPVLRVCQFPMQFCPGWHQLTQGPVSDHSTGQHSQGSYTLLFVNHSGMSPQLESFAMGGCAGGSVSFPLVCQTCQISLPERSNPAGTSDTTPGLLSALKNHPAWGTTREKPQPCLVAGEVSP